MITVPTTSFLKWAGGKRRQVPSIFSKWRGHEHRRFVDLTCGAANVPLGLAPKQALLNDVNPHLINLFRQVQAGLAIDMEMRHDRDTFLQCRYQFNCLIRSGAADTPEAALLFYYLNRSGFNGLCRFNRSGEFNVPFGDYKSVNYLRSFDDYRAVFEAWEFRCGDYAQVVLQPSDFVYADPPYDSVEDASADEVHMALLPEGISQGRGFTTYSAGGFTWADQVKLAEKLAAHPGPAVAHNAPTPRIVDLYQQLGFMSNSINSRADGRGKVPEMLAWRLPHAA